MDEDVEGRAAFEGERAGVIEINREDESKEPQKNSRAAEQPENIEERNLRNGNLPTERLELRIVAARTEKISPLARIKAVTFGVDDVIDAVEQKT